MLNIIKKIVVLSTCVVSLSTGSRTSFAVCMVHMPASRFMPLLRAERDKLHLFVKREGQWYSAPLQIDPMNVNGRLLFPKGKWSQEMISGFDRLQFRAKDLGERSNIASLPCTAKSYEIRVKKKNSWHYGYLAACKSRQRQPSQSPLHYDPKNRNLQTSHYWYSYHKSNQMLFERVYTTHKGEYQPMISDSRLDIYADIKRFFNLHFGARDIESRLEKHDIRSLGAVASVSFFLKILFFRIKLSLTTDVNFYEDAAFIPMHISLPVAGKDYLNRGSGILYSFKLAKGVRAQQIEMPAVESFGRSSKAKYCNKYSCDYRAVFSDGRKGINFFFKMPRPLVDMGFSPYFVKNAATLEKTLPRYKKYMSSERDVGFFMPTHALEKGQHPWGLKIQFADVPLEASIACRPKVIVRRL